MRELGEITLSASDASTPLVAALSLEPVPGDVEGNLRLAEWRVRAAKRAHPDLRWIVLPELFTSAYLDLASIHRHAEDAKGDHQPASYFGSRGSRTST